MTLTAAGSPYTGTSTTISTGVTVIAEPGAIVKLTGALTVKGTFDVNGTAELPVVFTSSKDTAAGQWTGLVLQAGAGGSSISHAEVRYAKTGIAVSGGISPSISHDVVHHSSSTGISISGGGAPEIAYNEVSDNGNTGIAYSFSGTPGNQLNIHDNLIERNDYGGGIRVSGSGTSLGLVSFHGNEVNDSTGEGKAISFEGPVIPPDIDENELSGNSKNGIWVSGTLTESTTWEDRGYPFVSAWSGITVAKGATLTLEPGFTIKGEHDGMTVEGGLIAEGTAEEPITFTSIKDDSVDGDTNGNGSATAPEPGDWPGIVYPTATGAELSYVALYYAKAAIEVQYLESMWISNSNLIANKAAIKVAQTAENDPELQALSCVPPYLSFMVSEDNWYGDTGFPTPSIDVSEIVGEIVPEEYSLLFEQGVGLAVEIASLYSSGDTIPFAIYSCPELGIPPTPVTPVIVTSTASTPWFS